MSKKRFAHAVIAMAVVGFPAHAFAYGEFAWPATGKLAQRPAGSPKAIEITIDPITNGSRKAGAARTGTVTAVLPDVVLQHENGYESRYELGNMDVKVGDQPKKGASLGNPTESYPHFVFHVIRYGAEQLVPGSAGDAVKRGDPIPVTYPGLPAIPVLATNPFADHLFMLYPNTPNDVECRPYSDNGFPQSGMFKVTDTVFANVIFHLGPAGGHLVSIESRFVGSSLEVHHVNGGLMYDARLRDAPNGHVLPFSLPYFEESVKILECQMVGNSAWYRVESKWRPMVKGWVDGGLDYLSKVGMSFASSGSSGSSSSSGSSGMGVEYDPQSGLYLDFSNPPKWYDSAGHRVNPPAGASGLPASAQPNAPATLGYLGPQFSGPSSHSIH